MSGFDESEFANDERTKQEAMIDAKHIEKLKKDLVQISSRNGSVKASDEMKGGHN